MNILGRSSAMAVGKHRHHHGRDLRDGRSTGDRRGARRRGWCYYAVPVSLVARSQLLVEERSGQR